MVIGYPKPSKPLHYADVLMAFVFYLFEIDSLYRNVAAYADKIAGYDMKYTKMIASQLEFM